MPGFHRSFQSLRHDPLVDESERNREPTRLGFGNLSDSDRETASFGKLTVVTCMFLDEEVVTTPDVAIKRAQGHKSQLRIWLFFAPLRLAFEQLPVRVAVVLFHVLLGAVSTRRSHQEILAPAG